MIVCNKYDVIFCHVPKTGGSSIKTILLNEFEGEKHHVHIPIRKAKRIVVDPSQYIKFAVVRNPYGRMVSWYNHLIRESEHGKSKEVIVRPKSFEDFVKNQTQIYKNKQQNQFQLWDTQKSFLMNGDKIGVDYILYYETLENDFKYFCKRFFGKVYPLPHLKKWGVQMDYVDYYNDELAEIVYNRMEEDFKYFIYEKDYNKKC